MPLMNAALVDMGNTLDTNITEISLHSADPGTTGTSETSAGRQVPSFTVDADGDLTLDATESFTGGAANGPCTWLGIWKGATFYGKEALTGDQTFNAAGEYNVTGVTINLTSP